MPSHYNAADLFAIAQGRLSLRREPRVATDPLPHRTLKPAVLIRATALPLSRSRMLSAADILAISRHQQPWQALGAGGGRLEEAG